MQKSIVRMMAIALAFLLVIFLGACSSGGSTSAKATSSDVGSQGPSVDALKGLEPRQALALANTWKTTASDITSFVDAKKISFEFPNGKKASVRLPEAKMVVAIAPYINKTHPCETHYTSGCQGELVNVPIKVYGKTTDGLVIVDKTIDTMSNGFFELWLARDLEIDLTVEYGGRTATQRITTYIDSNTCITTMHL